jgi:nitrogenase subunit NifH
LRFGDGCRRSSGGQVALTGINTLVQGGPAPGVGIVGKDALDVFVVKEARAIDELVEHARRKWVGGMVCA